MKEVKKDTIEEMLKSYTIYESDIKSKLHQIIKENLKTVDAATSSYNGLPGKTGYKDCSLETVAINKTDAVAQLESEILELKAKIIMIDGYINTLSKFNQDIIKAYYIDHLREEEIANNKNRMLRAIQEAKRKSIKKMQELYDKR